MLDRLQQVGIGANLAPFSSCSGRVRFPRTIKALAIIWMPLVATACATDGKPGDAEATKAAPASFNCSEPRPQVCTMIYAPVCAEYDDGSSETLASACNACAVATVTAYAKGPCEDTGVP